jgi:hypothetical protein
MKKIFSLFVAGSMMFMSGCDGDFEELNKDPNAATAEKFNPAYLFTTAQLFSSRGDNSATLHYAEPFVQHFSTLSDAGTFDFYGDKYVYNKGGSESLWKNIFNPTNGGSKLLEDALQLSKGKEELSNLYNMARIWKTVIYHRLTDFYGDVPYSEANQGYYSKILQPKYDTQKDIYYNMLAELEDATSKLDVAKGAVTADILYNGDVAKWKKLGYSLMLRLGMRLQKVEPATAESWVKKAVAGGVFASVDDNAFVRFPDKTGAQTNLVNDESWTLSVSGPNPGKISATYFNFLKSHNDPRLKYTVAVYSNPAQASTKNTDPAIQKGMPNGFNLVTIKTDPSWDDKNAAGAHQYSGINRDVYAKIDGPRMLITYGEVQFMMAEAAIRGWISGDAATFYKNGVAGAMKNLAKYEATAVITDAEINTYLTANPFVGVADKEKAYEQINTQYWAACFLNGLEAFANVRRSGYPKLIPVNYYLGNETDGTYPRRVRYPEDEPALNSENYKAVVARQGADTFKTRVWWDKQ